MLKFFKSLYLTQRLFVAIFGIGVLFLFSNWITPLYTISWMLSLLLLVLFLADMISLYNTPPLEADRILPEKFSNSDQNLVLVKIKNKSNLNLKVEVIDELPVQFQKRDFLKILNLTSGSTQHFEYFVRPVTRGEYVFGKLNLFVSTRLNLSKRRSVYNKDQMVKVYPSFIQMKKLDFLAIDNKISQAGLKKIRRIGHTMEFEQIKEYVPGDDVRTINWKATAKQAHLMVNQYQDEKAQPIYSIIDTGRVMKMPFKGMSLLDYAINSSLAFSNVALKKKDKVGLITFSHQLQILLKANLRFSQLNTVMETLYNVKTRFLDSDFGLLYANIKNHVSQRSLLFLYTNFEHISALERQLPYLKALNKKHVLVVIFFKNTELDRIIKSFPETIVESANQTIAEQFMHDKELMAKELQKHGIQTVLTAPEELSINTINKYLEIKARGIL